MQMNTTLYHSRTSRELSPDPNSAQLWFLQVVDAMHPVATDLEY